VKFEVHGLLCSAKRVKETGRKDKSEPLALTFRYFQFLWCLDAALSFGAEDFRGMIGRPYGAAVI